MEKCEKIEELFENGERKLIFHCENKSLLLNDNSVFNLLLQFGSINCLREFFNDIKLNEIEYFFEKKKINYIVQ